MAPILLTVSGKTNSIRQASQRQATRTEIIEAAWEAVRENGLAGLSMRDLGQRVGMRAQSIYSYFGSKHEIYDAMFLEGYRAFIESMDAASKESSSATTDSRHAARQAVHNFVDFCTAEPVRYQLLFQRTIPGFAPSEGSYAVAVEAYEQIRKQLAVFGVNDQETLDLWSATMTGLTDQQLSNDPGGDRWKRLIDRAVDMLIADVLIHNENEGS